MQTLDFVSGLHNCLEFSQPLSCLYQAMQTRKTFSIALVGVLFAYFDYLLESVGFKTCKLGGSHHSKITSSKPTVFSSFVLFFLVLFRLYIYIFFWGLSTYSTCEISYHFEILSSRVDPTKKELISCPGQR